MIAFAVILVQAAEEAGMKVPPDPENFEAEEYPHWNVFCVFQIGKAVRYHGEHFQNAEVIAKIPDDQIRTITYGGLLSLGVSD